MAIYADESLVLRVDAVAELFNAPAANPFAAGEGNILGEAALERLLLRQQVEPRRDLANIPLVVELPADQITPDLEPQLAAAIQSYCVARIENNRLQIRRSRLQNSVGMAAVLLAVLAVGAIVFLLLTTVLANSPAIVQGMMTGGLCVFAWVILWDPLEALLFEWVTPTRENRVFAQIMKMRVSVQRQA